VKSESERNTHYKTEHERLVSSLIEGSSSSFVTPVSSMFSVFSPCRTPISTAGSSPLLSAPEISSSDVLYFGKTTSLKLSWGTPAKFTDRQTGF